MVYEGAEFVGVGIDVLVGDADEVAEGVAVGADDHASAGRVDPPDLGAQGVEEAEGEAFSLVGEVAEDFGGVGGLAGEAGQGEGDGGVVAYEVGDLAQLLWKPLGGGGGLVGGAAGAGSGSRC
ncbi:hypothetical protein GCM10010341_75590 [Streptomyces noursei]|nr:hypothetical protein GCM10010341_75590 [Streptomyces noursei]